MGDSLAAWTGDDRRNFTANVMDGALYAFGISFMSQQTIFPVFIKNIGGGNIAVGLIPVIWTFGFNASQMFIVSRAQREQRKKSLLLKTAMGQRIPWLFLALTTYFVLPHVGTTAGLIVVFVGWTLASWGGGFNLPVWFDLIAHVTPVRRRGRLFAARNIFGAVLGILGGAVAAVVLGAIPFPASFALLCALAFLLMMSSYYFLTRIVEPDAPVPPTARAASWSWQTTIREIVGTPGGFQRFVVGDALQITAGMANGFLTIYAFDRFNLSDAYAGTFTMVMMTGMIAGSLVFGILADRFGHKVNMLISSATTLVACVIALTAPTVLVYSIVFVLASWSVTLTGISRLPLIAELCTPAQRPSYVAVTNLLTAPFVLVGIMAGWVVDAFGFASLFTVAGIAALASSIWWYTMVDEPRRSIVKEESAG